MADSLENESVAALLSMKSQARHIPTTPSPVPARRDCSPRIRKRNRLIYNDHEDTTYTLSRSSPRKTVRVTSPTPTAVLPALPDKRVAQKVGLKLRNLLKLPKAHRFLCCEWFYSNIDQPLFLRENEFTRCLSDLFPNLKTRKLTRVQWCKIRRLLGKPRRCSPEFFAEERASLELKRSKIRQLQLRKNVDLDQFKDLPSEIPLPLVIGTKATARVRSPQDGLFYGSIDAVDTSNSTYRITFDRPGLGTFSIPDFEVLSNDPPEMMPITAFAQKIRPRNMYFTPRFIPIPSWPQQDNDPLLGEATSQPDVSFIDDGMLGGFPKKFLALLVRVTKILAIKKKNLNLLKKMHTDAERNLSRGQPMTFEFQKSYAALVLDFEHLDKDLSEYLNKVQTYCLEIAPEQGLQPVLQPSTIKDQCLKEALGYIEQRSEDENSPVVKNQNIVMLIAQLCSLMSQLKHLSTSEYNSFEFKSLSDTLIEIQSKLKKNNISLFKNDVEIHINHIRDGISQMGSLHAFSSQNM
ncbi:protein lin-9 homolog [Uloborus diversus]|uniref:protein lin-9 homolog n=1 Tax=Uloborus diversus TaxID=327109 RepID=UPI00240935A6|nr:protein lin-9 homolog [Uloborus diversus]